MKENANPKPQTHCCPCSRPSEEELCSKSNARSRREFLQQSGISIASVAMTGLTWSALSAEAAEAKALETPRRRPLVVKPVFTFETPTRRPQTSWRSWGGIETEGQAREEILRIQGELTRLKAEADFPIEFLPLSSGKTAADLAKITDGDKADLILVYAAGGSDPNLFAPLVQKGKDLIYFLRHTSGPLSFWYEAISPWYLRGNKSDRVIVKEIDADDVVVDSLAELTWRLRALCGLKNARGTKIVAIGGAIGWGAAYKTAPALAKEKWKMEIQEVTYQALEKLMKAAFNDADQVRRARGRAAEYLKDPGVKLEIDKLAVENAFLLEHVFRLLMAQAGCHAITIAGCMATVMPIAQTSACLALSTLNDAGYLAFCESDFVVIPAGLLLSHIAGRPHFLNDPTYPHGNVITLAHCTAPRKMDGKSLDPVRIVTHFESDYGAAPKVEFRPGQKVTSIIPDFAQARWIGLLGEIVGVPFLPICRAQMDISYKVSDRKLIENMPGFHWETIYGDYLREVGYALKKTPIKWEPLG